MFATSYTVPPSPAKSKRRTRTGDRRSSRLEVEALEDRCVPTTTIRPMSDFVDQQGTFCIDDGAGGCFLFVPPVENFIGWSDPAREYGVSVDYAGLADDVVGGAFGTTFSGTVRERALSDGRAEVLVNLHTQNALTWAINLDPNDPGNPFGDNPLIFGARVTDVQNGATPALGQSHLQVKFINDAPGDPLPDLLQLFIAPEPGQEPVSLKFRGQASGELRAEFGVADGTPGQITVSQTGLFNTSFMGATADGFPAELININPVGNSGKGPQGGPNASEAAAIAALFAAADVSDD